MPYADGDGRSVSINANAARDQALQPVEHEHEHAPLGAERASDVRRTRIARTDLGDVDALAAGDHHGGWEGAQEVRGYEHQPDLPSLLSW